MANLDNIISMVAQTEDDNGATSTNLQQAKTWLEEMVAKQAEDGIGEDLLGRLVNAQNQAEEAQGAAAGLGAALEAFKVALGACA